MKIRYCLQLKPYQVLDETEALQLQNILLVK